MRFSRVLLLLVLVVSGPGVRAQSPPPVAPVVTPPPFDEWLTALKAEAIERGIAAELVERAFTGIQPVEQILERDRTQAEFALDLEAYLKRRLTPQTIRIAQQMYTKHRDLLRKVETTYGVSSRIVVSIWGLESNFGRFAGVRPTIPALVTLAYDPRRGAMFRDELFNALQIVNRGDIPLEQLKGSWAGALGQPQFLPSSYLEYAQDFDGDGSKDIWKSRPDVFASIAFYLQKHGWKAGEAWGREVRIASLLKEATLAIPRREAGCRAQKLMTEPRPLAEWKKMGLRTTADAALPKSEMPASMVVAGTRTFLLYDNYEALLGYNCAHSYALSVALLADRLR
ncbi:MAG: lytic murein transglycosylase [Acidobacteriota bacterium]|nr:lytic murein transglycosylase [Acidobacteriota bacterium]MDQ3420077.1 lytic murein transglycosylase [Acidobacteriota bacterium]